MSALWAGRVRAHMVAGENPLKRYLRYRSSGRLTRTEQQELTTEIIGQLHERVIALENRP